ncbi:MAG: RNA polymerase sigma factor [Bacteroidetes bacterium]|nr:RNA polymerase sigma factor [Bacteroidota bacterium]
MTAIEFSHKLIGLQDNLHYFANLLTSNDEDAKDLVQDTLYKALINRDKFLPDTNLKAWTYTIMKNTFINNYRRNVKSNTILDISEDLYYLRNRASDTGDMPDNGLAVEDITKSIESLEEDQRMPFEMHTAGYKYKEIADALDLSIGTVKSRIFFTRKKLMDSLKAYKTN